MANVLCITGMHRSGSSLTTSWLQGCGLKIFDDRLISSLYGNWKGHYEDADFVDLQSSVIRGAFPGSNGWKVFNQCSLNFDGNYKESANELINERNAKYDIWGWKDPRTVLFLDQWKELIPNLKVLLLWRPCCFVVNSLIRRSREAEENVFKLSVLEACKLWISYNERICRYKKEQNLDTMILPISHIIYNDYLSFNLIINHLKINLKYNSISDLFDKIHFHDDSTSLLSRLVCSNNRIKTLENQLQNLSDD